MEIRGKEILLRLSAAQADLLNQGYLLYMKKHVEIISRSDYIRECIKDVSERLISEEETET